MLAVVTDENVKQLVQGSLENVKSNQHRVEKLETMIEEMAPKVTKIYDFLEEQKTKIDKNLKIYMVIIAVISLLPSFYLIFFNK